MDPAVGSLQLAHLVLEGAVMTVSVELCIRCLFTQEHRRSKFVRFLKIVMALGLAIKSGIFASFSSDSLNDCRAAGRLADAMYHVSSVAGLWVLLIRVRTVVPSRHRIATTAFHTFLLVVRSSVGLVDVFVTHIWKDPTTGTCVYYTRHEVGITYTMLDCVSDIYVSTAIATILTLHVRRLQVCGTAGNINLYFSVVFTNVIRTVILSALNLVVTVYFILNDSDPVFITIIWPVTNIFFVVLIGYDKDIINTISQLDLLSQNLEESLRVRPVASVHSNSILPSQLPQIPTSDNVAKQLSHCQEEMAVKDEETVNGSSGSTNWWSRC